MSDDVIALQREIEALRAKLDHLHAGGVGYYGSTLAQRDWFNLKRMPEQGLDRNAVRLMIENAHTLDFDHRLNTSSYVNVSLEPEEEQIAAMGLRVNLADQTVYPQSYKLHDTAVNMIADLWHCPQGEEYEEYGVAPGAGTVGSTEACLLAGLALKFRWRSWYAKRHGLTADDVLSVRPNLIISSCFQAAWEKLFKYMDVEPRILTPSVSTFTLDPQGVEAAIDEHTMGVVCIMGNHYGGQYDPVQAVSEVLDRVNAERGLQVGIHVDAASGGFIAPFQDDVPPWDFRLPNVLSISSSGHKYGESICGTGWVVWRQRRDLSEHVAISVTYLGGKAESYTLNFSRPAAGVYAQYYKLLHFGRSGYRQVCDNMMANASYLREGLRSMTRNGKPRFHILDAGDEGLPARGHGHAEPGVRIRLRRRGFAACPVPTPLVRGQLSHAVRPSADARAVAALPRRGVRCLDVSHRRKEQPHAQHGAAPARIDRRRLGVPGFRGRHEPAGVRAPSPAAQGSAALHRSLLRGGAAHVLPTRYTSSCTPPPRSCRWRTRWACPPRSTR